MPPLTRHIVHQHKVIASFYGVALRALLQPLRNRSEASELLPGPELTLEIPAPPAALIRDYVRHVGGNSRAYSGTIPPHLFPHWSLPLAARTLRNLRYPLLRVLNGGCRLEINAPLAAEEPLRVSARLESVTDDGRRAVLHQRIVTGQRSCPEALVAHVYAVVPSAPRGAAEARPHQAKEVQRVPLGARQIDCLGLTRNAGLDFALLTGDFNPVHWVAPYARVLGHRGSILHGFASMAHVYESLQRALFGGAIDRIRVFDVRFVRPLVLPSAVAVYVKGNAFFLGSPGEPAILTGNYASAEQSLAEIAFERAPRATNETSPRPGVRS
jgi:acyl dehydratase